MSNQAEQAYDASASFFVIEFKRRLARYGSWYNRIKRMQMGVARGIDGIQQPYVVRERMMYSLDLMTRLLLLSRRAAGYGLMCSIVINMTLLWYLPYRLFERLWPSQLALDMVLSGCLRIVLLVAFERLFTMLTTFSGWFRQEFDAIRHEAKQLDAQHPADFRSDLAILSGTSRENSGAASFLLDLVCSPRPR